VIVDVAMVVSAMLAAADPVPAMPTRPPTVHWSAGVDIGLPTDFDDSGLWSNGYAAGVSGYWSVNGAVSVGMRFGIEHWSYNQGSVLSELVPPNATIVVEKSTGSVQVLEFSPFVRYWREGIVGSKAGGFVQASAELAFVKPYALTQVSYDLGARGGQAMFEINESSWRPAVWTAAGLTFEVSDQSWIELFPSYRAIFENGGTTSLWALSLGFKMRV
jgi:hypothetical protein